MKLITKQGRTLPRQWLVLAIVMLLSGCVSSSGQHGGRDSRKAAEDRTAKAVDTHIQLAVGYLQRGQYEVALEKIEVALEIDSKSGDAHTVAGTINEQIGRYEEADHHYRLAAKLEPENGGILNNYGQFLCRNEKVAEAEKYFKRAVEDPFYKTPAAALGNACSCLVTVGQVERAEQYCRNAIEQDAQAPEPYYHLAQVFYQLKQYMKARAFLQRYASVGPNTAESLMLCVQIEGELEAEDLASSCRDRLLKGFPKSSQARELEK